MPHHKTKTPAAADTAGQRNDHVFGHKHDHTGADHAAQPPAYGLSYVAKTSQRHGRPRVVVIGGGKCVGHASQFGSSWRVYLAEGSETVSSDIAANLRPRDAAWRIGGAS